MRKGQQPPWIVPDGLWERLEPLLPKRERRFQYPGRKPLDDRKALCRSCSCCTPASRGSSCPRSWGVRVGDDLVAAATRLACRRSVAAATRIATGRTAGRRTGSKHHVLTEAGGVPLAVSLTGAQRNDVTQLLPLTDAVPPVRGRRGRPRQRPAQLYADRGYDHDSHRRRVRVRGIQPVIGRRGTPHGSGLGIYRWVVEQTIALLHWMRRLRIRWEIRDDIHEAFLTLGCAVICYRRLRGSFR